MNRLRPYLLSTITTLLVFFSCKPTANENKEISPTKILFVVTSHGELGNTGKTTGYFLSEVTHPYDVITNQGFEVDIMSPLGGKAPYDEMGFDMKDSINLLLWNDENFRSKIENTLKPSEVNADDYVAIYFAGGHGTMWDFPDNKAIANITTKIYENNGYVAAVCHGPAALINIKLSDGSYLVDGKKINAFTNAEETAIQLDTVVPFALETKLIERGAIFEKSGLWEVHVANDQRIITGQNPASATKVGTALISELADIQKN